MEENNSKIRRQIIKTDEFFVGKKGEKKMYLLRKNDLVFDKIASIIDFRRLRTTNRREERRAKRTYYYKFWLFESDYDYLKTEADKIPSTITLKKGHIYINKECEGFYKGNEISLLEYLDSLFA